MNCSGCNSNKNLHKNSTPITGKIEYYCSDCNQKRYLGHRKEHSIYYKKKNAEYKLICFGLFGGKCKRCGFSDSRALQIDHIGGGGTRDKKLFSSRNSLTHYKIVIKSITNKENKYQLLCANCNWIKRVENGETAKPRL